MKYQMTISPALEKGSSSVEFGYETAEQMIAAKDTAAGLLLFIQDEMKVMPDYSNMFILEENVDGEWLEYEEL